MFRCDKTKNGDTKTIERVKEREDPWQFWGSPLSYMLVYEDESS